jgi:hypothetical protein
MSQQQRDATARIIRLFARKPGHLWKWRDPDSNWGHHDFQLSGEGRDLAANGLQIAMFVNAGLARQSP